MGWKTRCWICNTRPTDRTGLCKTCRQAPGHVRGHFRALLWDHADVKEQRDEARAVARGLAALVDATDPGRKGQRFGALGSAVIGYHAIDEGNRPGALPWPDIRDLVDEMERRAMHRESGVIDLPVRKGT